MSKIGEELIEAALEALEIARADSARFDAVDYLKTPKDIAGYLEAVIEENDPELLKAALGDVARSAGMSQVAEEAGVTRGALYKALSETGDPKLSTLLGVCRALKIRIAFEAA